MRWTIFATAHDRTGVACDTTWPDFCQAVIEGLACEVPWDPVADPHARLAKVLLPAFSCTARDPNRTGSASVLSFCALAFDLDHASIEDLKSRVRISGCAALLYETPSSTDAAPKLRLVLPLDGPLEPQCYRAARDGVIAALGLEPDPVTHDAHRLSFVGGLSGTRPRQCWLFDGELTPSQGWAAAPAQSHADVEGGTADAPPDLLDAIAAALKPAWDRGDRQGWFLETLGWLRRDFTLADLEGIVDRLGDSPAGDNPTETYRAMCARARPLTGVSAATRLALGPAFDIADVLVRSHPGTVANRLSAALAQAAPRAPQGLVIPEGTVAQQAWATLGLRLVKYGGGASATYKPAASIDNVGLVLSLHPAWAGRLGYDQFADRVLVLDPPSLVEYSERDMSGEWADVHTTRLIAWLDRTLGFAPAVADANAAVDAVARRNGRHPVRDYLRSLQWDGAPRIDAALARYFGAEASEYTTAIGPRWLISMVARIMQPGCQVDTMPIFEGAQGVFKSTALRALTAPWFCSSKIDILSKDGQQNIQGVWLYEIAELDAFGRADASRIKNFVTDQVDRYRPPFGRRAVDHPRQCVFVGSTNEPHYLSDGTGNRRFWPVRCGTIDRVGIARDRDQIWAEAVARYDAGTAAHADCLWWLDRPGETNAKAEQSARETAADDPWFNTITAYVRAHPGATVGAILFAALLMPYAQQTRVTAARVQAVLRHAGATVEGDGFKL